MALAASVQAQAVMVKDEDLAMGSSTLPKFGPIY